MVIKFTWRAKEVSVDTVRIKPPINEAIRIVEDPMARNFSRYYLSIFHVAIRTATGDPLFTTEPNNYRSNRYGHGAWFEAGSINRYVEGWWGRRSGWCCGCTCGRDEGD